MTTGTLKPLPDPGLPWGAQNGRPTEPFAQYMQALDMVLRLLNGGTLGPMVAAANDGAAAASGVPINGMYRDAGGAVRIRLV